LVALEEERQMLTRACGKRDLCTVGVSVATMEISMEVPENNKNTIDI
jgi:hypothetical protein